MVGYSTHKKVILQNFKIVHIWTTSFILISVDYHLELWSAVTF